MNLSCVVIEIGIFLYFVLVVHRFGQRDHHPIHIVALSADQ